MTAVEGVVELRGDHRQRFALVRERSGERVAERMWVDASFNPCPSCETG